MRETNGQLAAGVHVAKDYAGSRGPTFLPQVPALDDRGNVLGNVVDGERPPVKKKDDSGLAGFNHGFHQVVLCAQEFERIAIAAMVLGPRLAVCALVLADNKN